MRNLYNYDKTFAAIISTEITQQNINCEREGKPRAAAQDELELYQPVEPPATQGYHH